MGQASADLATPAAGRRLTLARLMWLALVAISWAAYLAGLAAHYQELSVVCAGTPAECFQRPRPRMPPPCRPPA